jgi:hypothetical protein
VLWLAASSCRSSRRSGSRGYGRSSSATMGTAPPTHGYEATREAAMAAFEKSGAADKTLAAFLSGKLSGLMFRKLLSGPRHR